MSDKFNSWVKGIDAKYMTIFGKKPKPFTTKNLDSSTQELIMRSATLVRHLEIDPEDYTSLCRLAHYIQINSRLRAFNEQN